MTNIPEKESEQQESTIITPPNTPEAKEEEIQPPPYWQNAYIPVDSFQSGSQFRSS
jgi:hypothetical protein